MCTLHRSRVVVWPISPVCCLRFYSSLHLDVGRPAGWLLFFISLNIWWNFRPVYSLVNLIFWPFVFLPVFLCRCQDVKASPDFTILVLHVSSYLAQLPQSKVYHCCLPLSQYYFPLTTSCIFLRLNPQLLLIQISLRQRRAPPNVLIGSEAQEHARFQAGRGNGGGRVYLNPHLKAAAPRSSHTRLSLASGKQPK